MIEDWRKAEFDAADCMRRLGFVDAFTTQGSSDHGIDVTATGAVAQVKRLARPVGRPDLQRLAGASLDVETRLFFSLGGYTAEAIRYADQVEMALFTYTENRRYRACNEAAIELVEEMPGFIPTPPPPPPAPHRAASMGTTHTRRRTWSIDSQLVIVRILIAASLITVSAIVAYVPDESVKTFAFCAFLVCCLLLFAWKEYLDG